MLSFYKYTVNNVQNSALEQSNLGQIFLSLHHLSWMAFCIDQNYTSLKSISFSMENIRPNDLEVLHNHKRAQPFRTICAFLALSRGWRASAPQA